MHQVRWGTITTVEFTVSGGDLLGYILLLFRVVGAELGAGFWAWWSHRLMLFCFLFCVGKSTSKVHMYGTSASHTYYILHVYIHV